MPSTNNSINSQINNLSAHKHLLMVHCHCGYCKGSFCKSFKAFRFGTTNM